MVETDIDAQDPHFEFKQTIAMLSWIYKNCPRVRFVLKTSSDIFINTYKLVELADQEMYASNRMYGDLMRRISPARKNESKNHHPVTLEEWPWRYSIFIRRVVVASLVPVFVVVVVVIVVVAVFSTFLQYDSCDIIAVVYQSVIVKSYDVCF